MMTAAQREGVPVDRPVRELTPEQLRLVLYGNEGRRMAIRYTNTRGEDKVFRTSFEGVINNLYRRYQETSSPGVREEIERYMTESPCPGCAGTRLREEVRWVLLGGRSIAELASRPVVELHAF